MAENKQSTRVFIKQYSSTPHKILCGVFFFIGLAQMIFAPFAKEGSFVIFASGFSFSAMACFVYGINVWKISSDEEQLHIHYSSGKVKSIPWRDINDIQVVDWNDGSQKNLSIIYGGVGTYTKTLLVGGEFASDKIFLERLKGCKRLSL